MSSPERPIVEREVAVLQWLLDHAAETDVTSYRAHPLEKMIVLAPCTCGCASLEFQPGGWGGAAIVAQGWAVYPDGQRAGLILWGKAGEIVLLEIHDLDPGSARRFPELSNLRKWEQFFEG